MAGLYLHIPFCKRRCIYCDFFSTTQSEKKTTYVSSLCRELEMRKDYIGGETIETIYFGGGDSFTTVTRGLYQHIFPYI